jgi:hypothetical protein
VGRVDGTSRDNGRPAGVADAFQVSKDSVEPMRANRCRNLFSHKDSGPSGTGEAKQVGPQVPVIGGAALLSCNRKRLARRGTCPELALVGPAGEAGGERPSTDAGEEMALRVTEQISRCNVNNRSLIYVSGRKVSGVNQVAQPLGCVRVVLVVVRKRHRSP